MKTSTDYCQILIFLTEKRKGGEGFMHNTELSFQNKFCMVQRSWSDISCDQIVHVISLTKCTRRRLKEAHTMLSKSSSSILDLLPFRFISKSTPS